MEIIKNLTPLRGIAALAVVLLHIQVMFAASGLPWPDPTTLTHFIAKSYLFVDFFFLLSGFIITHVYTKAFLQGVTKQDYMTFLQHRLARVYPVHILFILAYIPLEMAKLFVVLRYPSMPAATPAFAGEFDLPSLLSELFLLNAFGLENGPKWNLPSWSIGAEWYNYMVFPFIVGLFYKFNNRMMAAAGIALLFSIYLLSSIRPDVQLNVHHDYGFLRCLVEFWIGILLYRVYEKRLGEGVFRCDSIFIVVAAYIGVMIHAGAYDFLIVMSMPLLVLAGALNTGRVSTFVNQRPLVYLGDISYSVYMSHAFMILLVGRVLKVVISPDFLVSLTVGQAAGLMLLTTAVIVAMTIVASAVIYAAFEVPARRWVRSLRWQGVMARGNA